MTEEPKSNDSSEILAQALNEMKKELGEKFSLETVNLAELERRTVLSADAESGTSIRADQVILSIMSSGHIGNGFFSINGLPV